jgi:hypothetical protein
MAVTPWRDDIRRGKVLTVFPTTRITGEWQRAFAAALAEFNRISTNQNLGVTLSSPKDITAPDKTGDGGARVQIDTGNGRLEYEALGQKFVAERNGKPIDFDPFALHGATQTLSLAFGNGPARMERAFIFVPETPMISVSVKASPKPDDFKQVQRGVGFGIRVFIIVHEFVHACGLSNAEHNSTGPDADVFTFGASAVSGAIDRPDDDKLLLHLAAPRPNVFAPPITIKRKVADLIRANWA